MLYLHPEFSQLRTYLHITKIKPL